MVCPVFLSTFLCQNNSHIAVSDPDTTLPGTSGKRIPGRAGLRAIAKAVTGDIAASTAAGAITTAFMTAVPAASAATFVRRTAVSISIHAPT